MRMLMSIRTEKKWLTRFLFMQNAFCAGVNNVCHLLEAKAIDAALSICCLIMADSAELLLLRTAQRSGFDKQAEI